MGLKDKAAKHAYDLAWARAHPEVVRARYRRRMYGVTSAEVAAMEALQQHRCGICRAPFVKTPHVDHDHASGKFRGMLCGNCNHLLGKAGDSIDVLLGAVAYLQRTQ